MNIREMTIHLKILLLDMGASAESLHYFISSLRDTMLISIMAGDLQYITENFPVD
jgi:hypothetical protein